ncbi:MAG TPA: hypothetical protein VLT17_10320 [Gemmatimonadales bacterium]|jgi:hypothetical protein|nr:hypothetical protein [Gemmatimonadales bacterium]
MTFGARWLVLLPLVCGPVAASAQQPGTESPSAAVRQREQSPRTWETCLPRACTQTVVAFVGYRDCRTYAAYRGRDWKGCVASDKPATATWETCAPGRCTQTVVTFADLEDCQAYAEDHPGSKLCTRPGGW